MDKLSVIITAYDRHDVTKIHVDHCMNAHRQPDEIIVVNDGGDPSLKEMLKPYGQRMRLVYARINEDIPWNYNGACNLGVWLSSGNYIAFEDNDNMPAPSFYEDALKILKERKEIGRVLAKRRLLVEDIFKPFNEWKIVKGMGPNQGTYIMRREVYLKLKGQDENFCGRYGWMYYDWKHRLLVGAGAVFSSIGTFYYVVDGQSNLKRKLEKENYRHYRINAVLKRYQPDNILNFKYEFQVL